MKHKTETKTAQQIVNYFRRLKGNSTFATIEMKNSFNELTLNVCIGYNYKKAVSKRDSNYKLGKNKWGKRVNAYLLKYNGNYYLQVMVLSIIRKKVIKAKKTYYNYNPTRTIRIKISNIKRITINNKRINVK